LDDCSGEGAIKGNGLIQGSLEKDKKVHDGPAVVTMGTKLERKLVFNGNLRTTLVRERKRGSTPGSTKS